MIIKLAIALLVVRRDLGRAGGTARRRRVLRRQLARAAHEAHQPTPPCASLSSPR